MHHSCRVKPTCMMSSSKKPARVSMLPPPETRGMHETQTIEGVTTATPSKSGRLDLTPSHVHDPATKKWTQIDEILSIGKALFRDTGTLSRQVMRMHLNPVT